MIKVKIKKILQTFVIANELKKEFGEIKQISEYKEIYSKIENKVLKYSEKELFRHTTDKHRIKRYKSCDWYFGRIKIANTGVWPRMGKIPDDLLYKDTQWAANQIFKNSDKLPKDKLNHLLRIMSFASFLRAVLNASSLIILGTSLSR